MTLAIIGMASRFPGAEDLYGYWQLLRDGRSAIRPSGRTGEPGGFLDRADEFDAEFFGISPREAAEMDPQQRLVLELAWEALEDARIRPDALRDSATGVFIGAMADDYALLSRQRAATAHTLTGTRRSIIANRVSYLLGIHGPSMTVDTGQSSSLVAVHQAAESLVRGESRLALAGGVQLNLAAQTTAAMRELGALSPDGQCFTFDARANGIVRGEGGGVVVLKPLAEAVADGDRIYCVLLGGAVNSDGATDGLTVPSGQAQQELLADACQDAGVDPSLVQYVEAHGTGTRLGDPVEAEALRGVFGAGRAQPLRIGSVKTNIGHLEGAAGIAGLIKTALALHHGELPASLNYTEPNPLIDFTGLTVHSERMAWPDGEHLAGVSSFGLGGTNCHVVLGAAPVVPRQRTRSRTPVPWIISARTDQALRDHAAQLSEVDADAAGAGVSLLSRTMFARRAAVLGREGARLLAGGDIDPRVAQGRQRDGELAFLFPGQGVQRAAMGRELCEAYPVFAHAFDEACAAFELPLKDLLWQGDGWMDRMDQLQPALFVTEVALYRLFRAWGMDPAMLAGHSLGEITAAHVAGALSLEDAARFVTARGRLMAAVGGTAHAIEATEDQAREALAGKEDVAGIAAVNSPTSVVISGADEVVEETARQFAAQGWRTRRLRISGAVHSPLMEPVRAGLRDVVAGLDWREPRIPIVSSVTGERAAAEQLCSPDYWADHVLRTVRFGDAVRSLHEQGARVFVEVGPGEALTSMAAETLSDATCVPGLRTGLSEPEGAVMALAETHLAGHADLSRAIDGVPVDLPTYPFQRKRYWLDTVDEPEPVSDDIDELVAQSTAAALGTREPVDVHRTFKDLGFDSRLAVVLRNRLAAATGQDLPTTVLFDHPTPAQLAEALSGTETVTQEVAQTREDDIAIVAMSCRYPGGVASPEDLWRLVITETDATSEFPTDRDWDVAGIYDPAGGEGKTYTRRGGFLDDAGGFDARFFGISPREAAGIDPQQRVLLETAWEAFERAGLSQNEVRGSRTGVFVGAMAQEYGPRMHESADGHRLTGSSTSVASGRLAYFFGLRGPAITVDTACSSSLVSVHMAAQALRHGECSLALAGGVSVLGSPGIFIDFSGQHGLSEDGRCRAFSADATGTAWSEGVGLVVLERLSEATANGHPVLAVLRGSATNQDGASNGLTAPSGPAQERVIRAALDMAGLRPSDVDAIEAHGTGTELGDPIEARALAATYGRDRAEPAWLGSLKSNIGHAQAAAGVGGLIKMVQALRAGVLPRTLHITEPTPHVDWAASGLELLTGKVGWPRNGHPRRAAVSSFGISGTNAHVIIEEPPDSPDRPAHDGPVPWVLSARSAESVQRLAHRLREFLAEHPRRIDDVALTLAGRASFACRAAIVGSTTEELLADVRVVESRPAKTVFVFPGQGSQWRGMGLELMESSAVFRDRMRDCEKALAPYCDWSLTDALEGKGLERVDVVQPALFAVMVSLSELWRSAGVVPDAVIGHSQGEIAAACVAGALSLEDAAKVVALRSKALTSVAGTGGMASVPLPPDQTEARLGDGVHIAALNATGTTVVAGTVQGLDELTEACAKDGIEVRRIDVDYASHTPAMASLRDRLLAELADIQPQKPKIPLCSTVTGDQVSSMDAQYWYDNISNVVRFAPVTQTLIDQGHNVFIEVSAHPVLTPVIDATAMGTLRRDNGGLKQFLMAAANACTAGVDIDWRPFLPHARTTELPTYSFDHERYWLPTPTTAACPPGVSLSPHPLLGGEVELPTGGTLHTGRLNPGEHQWLNDHRVAGNTILPGTAMLDLALHAGPVEELVLHQPLPIGETDIRMTVADSAVTIESRAGEWITHATGRVGAAADFPRFDWPSDAEPVDLHGVYDRLAERGYEYGAAFRGLQALWRKGDEVYAEVEGEQFPALLDAALHAVLAADPDGPLEVPFSWHGVTRYRQAAALRVRLVRDGDITLAATTPEGEPVISVRKLVFRPFDRPGTLARLEWQEIEVPGEPADCPVLTPESCEDALARLQEWLAGPEPRLAVRTQNALAVHAGEPVPGFAQAGVLGLVRCAQAEHPDRLVLVDTDSADESQAVLPHALASGEQRLAIRSGKVYAPQVTAYEPALTAPDGPWRLDVTRRGTLDDLALVAHPEAMEPLAPGQVRLEVRAAGLNFRDVVVALDLVASETTMGSEGAGIVTEVGPDVTGFAVGDRVLGVFERALGPVAVADHRMLAPIPDGWSFPRASSVPIVFVTAYHALIRDARLQRGERVIIHTATGGVGLAAIQLARSVGAEVFATASPGKQHVLRDMGIDRDHIASSRDTEFSERFRDIDVVLNSLPGEMVDASLQVLKPGGRFVEIGKTDIRDSVDADYHAYNILGEDPDEVGAALRAVLSIAEPLPLTTMDVRSGHKALRTLSRGGHIGKLVLTMPRQWREPVLITGGTGTLGTALARHLVTQHGVRDLVLVSRSGGAVDIDGADVRVIRCDMTDRQAVAELLDDVRPSVIVHAAGVLRDGMFDSLTPERLAEAMDAKAMAAIHLHELAGDVDAFILYSSVIGVLGAPGQANYAAANAVLDSLAQHRAALGLPATAIAWGLWAERSGMTSHLSEQQVRKLRPLTTEQGLALFDRAIAAGEPTLIAARPGFATGPRKETPAEEAIQDDVLDLVRQQAADVLGYPGGIRPDETFRELGFDSLLSVELRNRINTATGLRLAAESVLEHPTPAALAGLIKRTMEGDGNG